MKQLGNLLWFILLLVVIPVACTSSPPDEEAQLRQVIERLAKSIEEHDRTAIMQQLDDDFRTREGLLPPDINRMLFAQFRQNKQIQVFLFNLQVNLMPRMADAQLEALLLGSSQWLPERGQRYQVKMRWRKRDDEWRLLRLDWQPLAASP